MDSEGRLQFSKLSSVNYRQWSFTIKAVLASKDLIQYINTKVDDLIDDKVRELSESTPSPEPAQPDVQSIKSDGSLPEQLHGYCRYRCQLRDGKATKELQLRSNARALIVII